MKRNNGGRVDGRGVDGWWMSGIGMKKRRETLVESKNQKQQINKKQPRKQTNKQKSTIFSWDESLREVWRGNCKHGRWISRFQEEYY